MRLQTYATMDNIDLVRVHGVMMNTPLSPGDMCCLHRDHRCLGTVISHQRFGAITVLWSSEPFKNTEGARCADQE